jgi:oxygen-independent coproporphyrinogen-3 oxidase
MLEIDDDSRLGREIGIGGLRYHAAEIPSDDAIADFYSEAIDFFAEQGIAQYEISNFARPGRESRHNRKYWQRRPYLGIGLDAHSMLRTDSGSALRFATTDDLQTFLKTPGWEDTPQHLRRSEELEEAWFLGLRLNSGVDLDTLKAEFGVPAVSRFEPVLDELAGEGLIERAGDTVKLTRRGQLISNDVFALFLPESENIQEGVPKLSSQAEISVLQGPPTC